jgi:hypothetical protein
MAAAMTTAVAKVAITSGLTRLNGAVAALFQATDTNSFSAVCQALADAADADDLRFLDAVDRAQNLATACGLVKIIGQDAVQANMVQSFKRCRVHQRPSPELAVIAARLATELCSADLTPTERLRRLWFVAAAARDCGPPDLLVKVFVAAARRAGLYRGDVEHVVRWALLRRDPWGSS